MSTMLRVIGRRKWMASMLAAVAMMVMTAIPAVADERDFLFSNISGMVIDQLYVSPSHQDAWGVDILGVDVLADGGSGMVKFSGLDPNAGCLYDIRVVGEDGVNYDAFEFDLCTVLEIDFAGPNAEFLFYYR